jgi:regulator of replication initiation timing
MTELNKRSPELQPVTVPALVVKEYNQLKLENDKLKELLNAQEHTDNLEFLLRQKNEKISQLEAKAEAYDRLMRGGKKTLQEVADFFGVPMEWTGRKVMFRVGECTLSPSMQDFIELPDTPYVVKFEPKKLSTDND